jgi:hypothetical protein
MRRLIFILAVSLLGCGHASDATRPATHATASASTRPLLEPIEMNYGVYLAGFELRVTVSPEGTLRGVQTHNKSYGKNDIDPSHERVEVREGRLTAEQMSDLAARFAGWGSLSSEPYGGPPDGGTVSIRYGDKTVSGGNEVPTEVTAIRVRLSELARAMPVVEP